MSITLRYRAVFSLLCLVFVPELAYAHPGVAGGGLHGMLHPFTGLDHLCAMIAVGIWAAQMGGRITWVLPATFVSVMTLGGWLGLSGVPLSFLEGGIVASLLILGILIAAAIRMPLSVSMALVGGFALFHGYAHGVEMPRNASGFNYALGFMSSTVLLHLTGIMLAFSLEKTGHKSYIKLAGVTIAALGGALCFAG
jgi:urease accessory protein